jgi:tocopherol O-methyltransferase
MSGYNDKQKIKEQYDAISPYCRSLWGEHLHHGYWPTGAESKEEAQVALTAHLAKTAGIHPGARILDVGCGFGGSSIYLAANYQAAVTGITISPVQVAMAQEAAHRANVNARFLVMDADHITLEDKFDVVWSIEAISHFTRKPEFFLRASEMLEPGGALALVDWFKRPELSESRYRSEVLPIERGMLVQLDTIAGYSALIEAGGLDVLLTQDLSASCARTWDICLDLIKNPALWQLAASRGVEFVRFLRSFAAMRKGFASGSFVYGMIVARKRGDGTRMRRV